MPQEAVLAAVIKLGLHRMLLPRRRESIGDFIGQPVNLLSNNRFGRNVLLRNIRLLKPLGNSMAAAVMPAATAITATTRNEYFFNRILPSYRIAS
jgi:hypothetical protein